ncbi:hypothetical protein ACHAWF_002524, partial [Thalassiosira exigua]
RTPATLTPARRPTSKAVFPTELAAPPAARCGPPPLSSSSEQHFPVSTGTKAQSICNQTEGLPIVILPARPTQNQPRDHLPPPSNTYY